MNQSIHTYDDAALPQQHYDTASMNDTLSSDWKTALLLSIIAGLSTCIGAAIVFCLDYDNNPASVGVNMRRGKASKLGPSHMAFSLMLAGSVMITVSIASILPESFLLDDDIHYTPFGSIDFIQRCIAFSVGCSIYIILSKYVFPAAPEEIIGTTFSGKDDCESSLTSLLPVMTNGLNDRTRRHGSEDSLILLLEEDESFTDPKEFLPVNASMSSKALQRKKNIASSSFDSLDEPPRIDADQNIGPTMKDKRMTNNTSFVKYITKYIRGTDLIDTEARRKWRVTMLLLISLAVHNFPEGLAVAASALHSPHLGITTTIAIALHNIPEGIAIAIPCLAARPDLPWLAFALASLSGLAEPMGAIVALLLIDQTSGDTIIDSIGTTNVQSSMYFLMWNAMFNMKNVLSFVAGIMMTVAIVELFPEAQRHMKESSFPGIIGALLGAMIMLASDAYLQK